ncbi:pseudouridine synthase [Prevotella sp.]|uniref:pseudouridine synthase n=1 Tax=Prevotella sp. TaxID=59823 RepID=UPI002F9216E6
MDQELENKSQSFSEEHENSREGYAASSGNNYSRDYRSGARPQRPRIHTQRAYSSERGNVNNNNQEEGGFRPEGFGANLMSGNNGQQRPYRPRNNYNNQGGYGQQRGGYGQQQRPYRPRYNDENQEGGYQPQQGGYRPRYDNNEQNQEGGYGQQGGYRPRNNYNNQGGYRPRNNYNNQGGYGQQRGGYGQQRGGYGQQQRGGYGQQRGYDQGGYRPRNNYNNQGGYGQQRGYNQGGYRQHTSDYDPNAKYSLKKRIEYKEEHIDPTQPLRLNKFLANAGVCSRREADEFIQAGVVTVNGVVVTELGTKVLRTDEVKFHEQPVSIEKKVYVLLNKPKDYVTTSDDPQQRKTVMDLVKDACPERIYPVGRLDRNTTGVLLLTNDGDLASKLTHPKFLKKKVYHVHLDKPVAQADLQKIAEGIELEDGEIHADAIEYADEHDKGQVGIEIHSGKNRIVRRIFESLGYRVVRLDRVQFAGLTKKNLRRGDWRFLTEKEVEILRSGMFE